VFNIGVEHSNEEGFRARFSVVESSHTELAAILSFNTFVVEVGELSG